MTLDSTATLGDRPAADAPRPAGVRAMRVALRLLAVAVFAQAVFAGLFLDGGDGWIGWHAVNGMLVLPLLALIQVALAVRVWRRDRGPGQLAAASGGLLLAILVQGALGESGQVAVHVPLGVAILGLVGTLLACARTLTRPPTARPDAPAS
jgi:hypothetical protein